MKIMRKFREVGKLEEKVDRLFDKVDKETNFERKASLLIDAMRMNNRYIEEYQELFGYVVLIMFGFVIAVIFIISLID